MQEFEARALTPAEPALNVADLLAQRVRQAPDTPLFARPDGDGWRDVTGAAFLAEVVALAKGFVAAGIGPGDRIGLLSSTRYEWTLLDYAIWTAGGVTLPIYETSSAEQVEWCLSNSDATAVVVEGDEHRAIVDGLRQKLIHLDHVWQIDPPTGEQGAVAELTAAGARVGDAELESRRRSVGADDLATLIYTSGTTGRPKGCVTTHGNFFAEVDNAIELLHPVFKSVSKDPASTLLFLPLSHVFGRMVAIGCMRARVRLGHAPSIQTEDLLADLAGFRPTFLLAIPYVLEKVYNTGRATAEKMGRASSFDRAARIAQRYGKAVEAAEHGTGPGPGLGLCRLALLCCRSLETRARCDF